MGTYCISKPDELYHHGILGMKWGIRRYQPYGTAYDAENKGKFVGDKKSQNGSNHISMDKTSDKSKSPTKREKAILSNYKRAGMSESEAAAALEKRKKIVKALAITAGVTIAAAGAYMAYRGLRGNVLDVTIPKNMQLQTLSDVTDKMKISDKNADFYTAFKSGDKSSYTGLFGEKIGFMGLPTGQFKTKYTAALSSDMKVASTKNAANAFKSLVNSDSSFKDSVIQKFGPMGEGKLINSQMNYKGFEKVVSKLKSGKPISNREYSKLYKAFNVGLVDNSSTGIEMKKKFYDSLRKIGYDGVIDFNDKAGKGLKTAAPAIIFNDSKISSITSEKLTKAAVNAEKTKALGRLLGIAQLQSPTTYVGIGAIPLLAGVSYDDKVTADARYKKYKAQQKGE